MTALEKMAPLGANVHGDDWVLKNRENTIWPELPIVDPHHHLWGAPRKPYLLDKLEEDLEPGHNVVATVFIECSERYEMDREDLLQPVGETRYIQQLTEEYNGAEPARTPRIAAGIVGYADLHFGERVIETLEQQVEAGKGRFRGIRQFSDVRAPMRTPSPGLFVRPAFLQGFRQLRKHQLSFEAWLHHDCLDDLIGLAEKNPDTIIVVNHVGGPLGIGEFSNRREEVFSSWQQQMKKLSLLANTRVKLGGLGMRLAGFGFEDRVEPANSSTLAAAWRPYMHACIDMFGVERSMFESNFPVDRLTCSYHTLWNTFKHLSDGFSETDRTWLFSRCAADTYRLDIA